jgi:hypothetical protein
MKKYLFIFLVCIYCFSLLPNNLKAQQIQSEEQLFRDALKITLLPHIHKEIIKCLKEFKTFGTYSMNFGTIDTKLLSIKRKEPNEPLKYETEFEVSTYEHAHNPPHFTINFTLGFNYSEYHISNCEIRGDDTFQEIESFYKETLDDIKQSFDLDLKDYKHYNPNELNNFGYNKIHQMVTDIARTTLGPDIEKTHPFKNIVAPITYLKENKGYILFKKGNGTNVVYFLEKINDIWIVQDKKEKKGKKMEAKLLWYY